MSRGASQISKENLQHILSLDGITFIREAYLAILVRPADLSGERAYARSLFRGVSKEELIVSLRLSKEGCLAAMKVPSFFAIRLKAIWRCYTRCFFSVFRFSGNQSTASTGWPLISREQVEACFRLFLRREPNEDEIFEFQFGHNESNSMIQAILARKEFLTLNLDVWEALPVHLEENLAHSNTQ